jgi:hypothetical protein
MSVGFVVRVSTMLLRRLVLKGILRSWLDTVLEADDCSEVGEVEVVVGGVGVFVLV